MEKHSFSIRGNQYEFKGHYIGFLNYYEKIFLKELQLFYMNNRILKASSVEKQEPDLYKLGIELYGGWKTARMQLKLPHKKTNSKIYGDIGELFVELILNDFKNKNRSLNPWLYAPKIEYYNAQTNIPFPELSSKFRLGRDIVKYHFSVPTNKKIEQEKITRQLPSGVIEIYYFKQNKEMFNEEKVRVSNELHFQQRYEKLIKQWKFLHLRINDIKKVALNRKHSSLIVLDKRKNKLKYPDFRLDFESNSPWAEVKSVYPQYLEKLIDSEENEEDMPVMPLGKGLIQKTIVKYSLPSKWFKGGSPHTSKNSYLEGFVFLHIPYEESNILSTQLSKDTFSFIKVIGSEEFSNLLKLFDFENNTNLLRQYKEFIDKPSKAIKTNLRNRLEKLLGKHQLRLF